MERQVKGIWIPIEIWESKELTWNEKILFLEIDSFTSKDKDCFFSNEHIAKLLGVTENSANRILSSLISKGYVVKTSFDGRRRFVKTAFSYDKADYSQMNNQPIQERITSYDNKEYIPNTSNNTDNKPNKERIDKSIQKKGFDFKSALLGLGIEENIVNDWLLVRKQKKATNTETAFNRIKNEIALSGISANECITMAVERSWMGFKAEWVKNATSSYKYQNNSLFSQTTNNVELHPELRQVDEDGRLNDGTYLKGGFRYYFSRISGSAISIPPKAEPKPNGDNFEYDYKLGWYECE